MGERRGFKPVVGRNRRRAPPHSNRTIRAIGRLLFCQIFRAHASMAIAAPYFRTRKRELERTWGCFPIVKARRYIRLRNRSHSINRFWFALAADSGSGRHPGLRPVFSLDTP